MPKATLTVDLDAIAANWRALDRLSAPGVETGAAVKADAYGLGLAPVATRLAGEGVRSFFVAQADEGAALRRALGPGPRIFVFEGFHASDTDCVAAGDLIPLLNAPEQAAAWRSAHPAAAYGLQLDSGMNRLGVAPAEIGALRTALPDAPPVLIMSHLACADSPAHPQNDTQRRRFAALADALPPAPRSLAATGGILLGAAFHGALVRPGIGLFGGHPFAAAQPAVRLSLPVLQTRRVAPGDSVGYGASWTARRPSRIATLGAGYADGLIRAAGNRAWVFAGDTPRPVPCPVVGRVSMDLIAADITDLAQTPQALDILGPAQGIDRLAEAAGTIGYEILTGLGARFHRVYKGAKT